MQSERNALIDEYAGAAFKYKDAGIPMSVWRQHFTEFAQKLSALPTEHEVSSRNDEAGYIEFLNEDVPYIVRDIAGPVATLTSVETRKVIGYRVYDPDSAFALTAQVQDVAGWRERVQQRISVYRDMRPEDDESWESWYFAAFDLLSADVTALPAAPAKQEG